MQLHDGQILDQHIAEMRTNEHVFVNLSSCTNYKIEVDLIWDSEESINEIDGKAIPPLTKSFTTLPDISKEVQLDMLENGLDFFTFSLTGTGWRTKIIYI